MGFPAHRTQNSIRFSLGAAKHRGRDRSRGRGASRGRREAADRSSGPEERGSRALRTSEPFMRIVVAMSGGVDSSVAAALLSEQGHDVIGLSMQLYLEDRGPTVIRPSAAAARSTICTTPGGWRPLSASRTTSSTSSRSSGTTVVENFVAEYASGRTPLPCAHCNSDLKFSTLLDRARGLGASHVATGHYARVEQDADGRWRLQSWRRPRQGSVVLPVLADAGSARGRGLSRRRAAQDRRASRRRGGSACASPTSPTARRSASCPTATMPRSSRARAARVAARRRHRRRDGPTARIARRRAPVHDRSAEGSRRLLADAHVRAEDRCRRGTRHGWSSRRRSSARR